jgi:hypothetical protein
VYGLVLESTFLSCAHGNRACSAPDTIHLGAVPANRYLQLLQCRLQALEDLCLLAVTQQSQCSSYLELNLGLSNVGLAAASTGNLLGLGDLVPDSLPQT